jgi:F-type H+-transporting ATPase subunit epsilon
LTDSQIILEIASPVGVHLSTPVEGVELPTTSGRIGVLPGHVRLGTTLEPGEIMVQQKGKQVTFFIGGGFAWIHPDRVKIMAVGLEPDFDDARFDDSRDRVRMLLGDSYDPKAIDVAFERARPLVHSAADSDRPGGNGETGSEQWLVEELRPAPQPSGISNADGTKTVRGP